MASAGEDNEVCEGEENTVNKDGNSATLKEGLCSSACMLVVFMHSQCRQLSFDFNSITVQQC